MEFLGDILDGVVGVLANAATGGVLGAALRFIPELIKGWQAKGDRAHELAMRRLDWEMARDAGEQKIREIDRAGEWSAVGKQFDALIAATRAQSRKTGIRFVDAWNASMRPGLTTYFALWYGAAKAALFYITLKASSSGVAGVAQAVLLVWTPEDQALFGGMLGFWFVGRVFESPRAAAR